MGRGRVISILAEQAFRGRLPPSDVGGLQRVRPDLSRHDPDLGPWSERPRRLFLEQERWMDRARGQVVTGDDPLFLHTCGCTQGRKETLAFRRPSELLSDTTKEGASGPQYRPAFGGSARRIAILILLSYLSLVLTLWDSAAGRKPGPLQTRVGRRHSSAFAAT